MPRKNVEVTAERLAEMIAEITQQCNYHQHAAIFKRRWPNHRDISSPKIGTITENMTTYHVCSTCYHDLLSAALGVDMFTTPRYRDLRRWKQAEASIGFVVDRNYKYTENEMAALAAAGH